ncbi:MAG: nucleotidyltransferase domain-containing protein [bacterium]|nr:nucleotidyltransferase domain-containing protein [bacterium]
MDDAFLEEVREAIRNIPDIGTLVVFGSRARGTDRPDSDLDVAFLPAAGYQSSPGLANDLRIRITVALAELAPEGRVDTVPLDTAPALLRQRVMEHGRMALCRDPEAWKALRVRTMKEYGDQLWARDLYRRAQRRRILEGRPSGRSARAFQSFERARRVSRRAEGVRALES